LIGLPDIAASNDEVRAADPEIAQLREFMDAWTSKGLTGSYTVSQLIGMAVPLGTDPWSAILLAVAADTRQRGSASKERLGRWLSRYKDRLLDGRCLRRSAAQGGYSILVGPPVTGRVGLVGSEPLLCPRLVRVCARTHGPQSRGLNPDNPYQEVFSPGCS
jgi:hypothetical protein